MKSASHCAVGLFTGSVVSSFYASIEVHFGLNALTAASVGVTVLGSVVCDLDSPHSPISKILPFLSKPIRRRFPHRTLLHSLLGLGLMTGAFWGLLKLLVVGLAFYGRTVLPVHSSLLTLLFASAVASHLVVDSTTRRGVKWLYPFLPYAFAYPSVERFRIITGDRRAEYLVTSISLALFFWFIPTTLSGASTSLNNFIGTYAQLKEVYRGAVSREVLLDFKGYYVGNRTPVSGSGLILSDTDSYFAVLFEDKVLFVGDEECDVILTDGQCSYLEIPPREDTAQFHNSAFADILNSVSGEVRISGRLESNQGFVVNKPYDTHVLVVTGSSITMSFASLEDIARLRPELHQKNPTSSQLSKEIEEEEQGIDSLVVARQKLTEPYPRDRLFSQIQERRQALKRLLAKSESPSSEPLLFSGTLTVRHLPSMQ